MRLPELANIRQAERLAEARMNALARIAQDRRRVAERKVAKSRG